MAGPDEVARGDRVKIGFHAERCVGLEVTGLVDHRVASAVVALVPTAVIGGWDGVGGRGDVLLALVDAQQARNQHTVEVAAICHIPDILERVKTSREDLVCGVVIFGHVFKYTDPPW